MSADPRAVADALLALTPEPPPITTDAAEVLALAEHMLAERAAALEAWAAAGVLGLDPRDAAAPLEQLRDREQRWSASLTRARHQLHERVASASRARSRYAP